MINISHCLPGLLSKESGVRCARIASEAHRHELAEPGQDGDGLGNCICEGV